MFYIIYIKCNTHSIPEIELFTIRRRLYFLRLVAATIYYTFDLNLAGIS